MQRKVRVGDTVLYYHEGSLKDCNNATYLPGIVTQTFGPLMANISVFIPHLQNESSDIARVWSAHHKSDIPQGSEGSGYWVYPEEVEGN